MAIDYQELGKEIAKNILILQNLTPSQILWNKEDCATYLKMSVRHFRDKVSKSNGFPEPKNLAGERDDKWIASEIIEWAIKQKRAS